VNVSEGVAEAVPFPPQHHKQLIWLIFRQSAESLSNVQSGFLSYILVF
jgi:hypothetical protein